MRDDFFSDFSITFFFEKETMKMKKFKNIIIEVILKLVDWLKSTSFMKKILYDNWNKQAFTDQWEHEKMLADKVRVDSYYRAITKHVKEGDTMIDLGTGTGILSFFASRKKPKVIYALDHSEIIETAKKIAKHNNTNSIKFIRTHSKDFTVPEKVDVIVHEQIGEYVFNESMVESITDLRDRLLKKNGKIIPNKFEVFIEPVTMREDYRVPFIWEQTVHNVRFDCLKCEKGEKLKNSEYYYHQCVQPYEVDSFLCKPEGVMAMDLETVQKEDLLRALKYRKTIERDGRLDGLCFYFKVIFDDEISFDISPKSRNTSWGIWIFRTKTEEFKKGDVLEFNWAIEDIKDIRSWTFQYQKVALA